MIQSQDIIPFSQVRAHLTELAEEVSSGKEKIITKNGESYVALIDVKRLDYYHQLEREHIHLGLLKEAAKGWADVENGKVFSMAKLRDKYKKKE